jgi:hypothetical protein
MPLHGFPGTVLWNKFDCPVPQVNTGNSHSHNVNYVWNTHGYRTHEFDQLADEYILTAGCSLTEGIGLHAQDRWSNLVEQQIGIQTINLGKGAANAEFVKHVITSWVHNQPIKPKFVIAQWPSTFRISKYANESLAFLVNHHNDPVFEAILKYSSMTFLDNWITAVIETNRWLQLCNIPCYNIMYYKQEFIDDTNKICTLLERQNITAHWDTVIDNTPTWELGADLALDNIHPGPKCNQQWSEHIINIINQS